MRAVALVMVDALRHDYLPADEAPFLSEAAQSLNHPTLVPPFGFEPDHAILAGLSPEEADAGAQFWRDPQSSPFRFIGPKVGGALDNLPSPARLAVRRLVMAIVGSTAKSARVRAHPTTARIPFRYLGQFDFVQKRDPWEAEYGLRPSLFRRAAARDFPWWFHGFPAHNVAAARVLARARRGLTGNERLLYFHIGDLDAVGHRHGPDSPQRRAVLGRVDDVVHELVDLLEARVGDVQVLVFGDHGMCVVERSVDVRPYLDALPHRPGRDYLFFLDSTLVRFWSDDPAVLDDIRGVLAELEDLEELDADARAKLAIRYRHRRFGDLMYQVRGGAVVHPSFFADAAPPRGMHGYGPDVPCDHAALAAFPAEPMREALGRCNRDAAAFPMRVIHDASAAFLDGLR